MKVELSLHRIRTQLISQIRVFRFKILIELDKIFTPFEILYDSNYIKCSSKQDYHVISQFLNINAYSNDSLLKFQIDYLEDCENQRIWKTFEQFVFLQDLFKQEKIIKFIIDEKSELKLNYDIKGQIQNTLNQYKKVPDSISPNEDPGIIELTKTSNQYLDAIIPFRRIQVAILTFISKKHYVLEFFMMIFSLIFIFYPYQMCIILFLISFLSQTKYILRIKLIQQSIQYFETNEGKIDQTKKNLNYINLVSNSLIKLCENLENIFIDQDRIFYYKFLNVLRISVGLLIITILFLPLKIIFVFLILILYCLRNLQEVQAGFYYLKPIKNIQLFQSKVKKIDQQQNNINSSVLSYNSDEQNLLRSTTLLPKKYFYYENQQWFVGVGFKGTPLSRYNFTDETGKIKIDPTNINPENGYVWKDDWKIVINSETDAKGWQYAKTFDGPYRNNAKPFYIVRRRVWERIAEKEKQI